MAAKPQAVTFKRFDGKLDTVLRKALPLELYERISTTESCIVVTHSGKKSQRHVILGHTALYVAEVPPKTVKRAIELVDVVSAKTVNDVPNFLPESERNDVLHIQIIYSVPLKDPPDHEDNERSRSASPKYPAQSPTGAAKRSVTPTAMNGVKPEDKRLTLLRSHELASQDSLWSSTLSLTPVSALDEPLASGGRSVSHRKLVTLDVYVLGKKGSSQLNYYLNVYLEDSLMRTLSGLPVSARLMSYESQQDSLISSFLSMKSELLSCTEYEELASLMTELKQGADKYFILKKMFWQDLQLVDFCITQLSPAQTSTIKDFYDRIEYHIIVSELLLTMLSETHVVQNRADLLTKDRGIRVSNLISGLIELFSSYKTDTMITQSLNELTGTVAGALYELIRMTVQQSWFNPERDSVVSPSWVCGIACSHPAAVNFLNQLVWLICERKDTDCTQLTEYRLVSLVHQLIHHSDSALKLFQTNFIEEFRYIISTSNSQSNHTEDKLKYVRSKILTKMH